MRDVLQLLSRQVSSDRQDAVLVRWAGLLAGGALLPLGLRAALRFTESSGELVIAVLGVLILALQLVGLGIVTSHAMTRDADRERMPPPAEGRNVLVTSASDRQQPQP